MRKSGILAMLLAGGLALQACDLLGGVGKGGGHEIEAVYRGGELHARYPAAFDRTWEEALSVVKELGMEVATAQGKEPVRKIQAKMDDGTAVTITLAPAGPDVTMASIRVGAQGDEESSMRIHRAIAARLQKK